MRKGSIVVYNGEEWYVEAIGAATGKLHLLHAGDVYDGLAYPRLTSADPEWVEVLAP